MEFEEHMRILIEKSRKNGYLEALLDIQGNNEVYTKFKDFLDSLWMKATKE